MEKYDCHDGYNEGMFTEIYIKIPIYIILMVTLCQLHLIYLAFSYLAPFVVSLTYTEPGDTLYM